MTPRPTPDTTSPFGLCVRCGDCGGTLDLVTSGQVDAGETRSILKCSHCRHEWLLVVRMARATTAIAEKRDGYRAAKVERDRVSA